MNYEITGTLVAKYDTQIISEKFKKREFVVEFREDVNGQPGMYANYAKLQLTNTKTELISAYNLGDEIKVNFNIRGNKYEKNGTTGYITNLDAWRISKPHNQEENRVNAPQANNSQPSNAPSAPPDFMTDTVIEDDLPF